MEDQMMVRTMSDDGRDVPLVEGGEAIAVTDENKREWLSLLLHHKLGGGVAEAMRSFRKGLLDVVGLQVRQNPPVPHQHPRRINFRHCVARKKMRGVAHCARDSKDVDSDDPACRWLSPYLCLLSAEELQLQCVALPLVPGSYRHVLNLVANM